MSEIAKRLRDRAAERRRVGWELSDAMLPGEMEAAAAELNSFTNTVRNEQRLHYSGTEWTDAEKAVLLKRSNE